MTTKKKKGKVSNGVKRKEEAVEDWCFVCKDGGLLLICENKNCSKAYHPECVGKDPSFLETGERWTCSRHSCFICHRSPEFHCIACPTAVCKRCIRTAEFVNFRRKKSFCNTCLRLVLLIEEDVDVDSDGGQVDFKDRETYEGLFKEYWELIKDKERVSLQDLHSADILLKKGEKYTSESDSDKLFKAEQEDESLISDFEDNMDDRMEDQPSSLMETAMKTMKRKIKKKKEFIGWGSRSLVEFLTSIGKDPSNPMSQFEVHGIINLYIHEKKLTHPVKKKKVVCDAMLHSVFGKKTVNRNRIYDLLEPHFAENQDSSEVDEFSDHSEEEGASNTCKRQRSTSLDKKTIEKDKILLAPRSHFASITAPNIKLIYLKRSVVEDLLKDTDTFEGRVVGSFVRVKCDPNDYFQKNSHQLLQVTGIMRASETVDNSTEVILQVSNMNKGVYIRMLSDDDFTEEECEDLHQRVKDGQLKKPTTWELEEKARVLHKSISHHWIERELALLQNLIDRANEKGWRRELCEYLERRRLLQSPTERQRLLDEVPSVIAEELEVEAVDLTEDDQPRNESNDDSPRSILMRASKILEGVAGKRTSSNLKDGGRKPAGDGDIYYQKSEILEIEGQESMSMSAAIEIFTPNLAEGEHGNGKAVNERVAENAEGQSAIRVQTFSAIVISDLAGDENRNGESINERAIEEVKACVTGALQHSSQVLVPEQQQEKSVVDVQGEQHQPQPNVNEEEHQVIEVVDQLNREINNLTGNKEDLEKVDQRRNIDVIELHDDDDDDDDQFESRILENPESAVWHYVDPFGDTQGPYSMNMLKKWREANYFKPDFKVWKTGQTQEKAILLTDAMTQVFP